MVCFRYILLNCSRDVAFLISLWSKFHNLGPVYLRLLGWAFWGSMRKLTTSSTTTKPTTTSLWVTSTPKLDRANVSELGTGPYGLGTRNARGDSLIIFAVRHQLKSMNTMFKKSPSRRWTWISPNGHTKNEIDFILTNRPHTFTDVSVIIIIIIIIIIITLIERQTFLLSIQGCLVHAMLCPFHAYDCQKVENSNWGMPTERDEFLD